MSRYTGPKCKLCRRSREKLFLKGDRCFTAKCAIEKRNFPPGPRTNVKKLSEYGVRLREKQKMRFTYFVTEKQMRNNFKEASRKRGVKGHMLLALFERRLDNVLYRAGAFKSRQAARQAVLHKKIFVDNKRVTIPSFLVAQNQSLSFVEESKAKILLENEAAVVVPAWLSVDYSQKQITVLSLPTRDVITTSLNDQLIVEYYSR